MSFEDTIKLIEAATKTHLTKFLIDEPPPAICHEVGGTAHLWAAATIIATWRLGIPLFVHTLSQKDMRRILRILSLDSVIRKSMIFYYKLEKCSSKMANEAADIIEKEHVHTSKHIAMVFRTLPVQLSGDIIDQITEHVIDKDYTERLNKIEMISTPWKKRIKKKIRTSLKKYIRKKN